MNKINTFLLLLTFGFNSISLSQQPTEQDCLGAIAICHTTFSTTSALPGTGNVPNEINPATSCLEAGEKNDVWYVFSVQTSGILCFTITPNFSLDDYDWAVYNLTSNTCSDIFGNPSLEISCNYAPDAGPTGPNGLGGPQNEACLFVFVGETYVINVSQFSPSPNGYSIDFSNSTASVFDYISPVLQSISTPISCGEDTLTFTFSEDVLCNTISESSFYLDGPGGPYTLTGIVSSVCDIGGTQDNTFKIGVSPPMQLGGNFELCVDSNSGVTDPCMNETPWLCLPFTVTGLSVSSTFINDVMCFGDSSGSAAVTASGGSPPYNYLWDDSSGQTDSLATGLSGGEYLVIATDIFGCSGDTSIFIAEPIVVSENSNVSCDVPTISDTMADCNASASVMVIGGTPPFSYQWYDSFFDSVPGETSDSISDLCIGSWIVITTDSFGCLDTTTVEIKGPQISDTTLLISCPGDCDGSAIILSLEGMPPYTYQWEQPLGNPILGETDSILDSICAGNFYLQIYTGNGCTLVSNVTVSDPILLGSNSTYTPSCFGACDGTAEAKPYDGIPPYTYSWQDPDLQTTAEASGLCPGLFTVYITDSKGCGPDTLEVIISEYPEIILTTNIADQECDTINGAATAVASGGSAPYTYEWDDPAASTSSGVIGLPAGVFSILITDANSCTAIEFVSIGYTDSAQGMINIADSISCKGATDGALFVSSLSGDTMPYQNWNTKDTASSINGLGAGFYTVIAYDTNGCPVSLSIELEEPDSISSASTFSSETSCNSMDGSIAINVDGGTMPYSFIWSPSVSTDSFVTGLVAGTYAVTINDANNCPPDTQSFELIEPPPITILVSYTDATCFEGNEGTASCSILSGGASPYIYLWTDTNSQTTSNATGLSAGIYSVYVTDINNCDTVTESVEILQPDEPIDVELSNTCNDGGGSISSVTTGGTPPYVYQWSDGSVSSDLSGLEKGTYTVTVTDIYNCPPDIGSTLVPNCFISIPTAFTPNGNGSNDTWEITNLSLIPESRVTVYNRWGDIVFNSTGYEIPWDGKHMLTNTVLPTAVYYYIIEGVNPDFVESGSSLQGNVTLVK